MGYRHLLETLRWDVLQLGCWRMGPVQRPGSELVPESQLVGLDTVAGNVGRTSVVNQAEMPQSHFSFFPWGLFSHFLKLVSFSEAAPNCCSAATLRLREPLKFPQ